MIYRWTDHISFSGHFLGVGLLFLFSASCSLGPPLGVHVHFAVTYTRIGFPPGDQRVSNVRQPQTPGVQKRRQAVIVGHVNALLSQINVIEDLIHDLRILASHRMVQSIPAMFIATHHIHGAHPGLLQDDLHQI